MKLKEDFDYKELLVKAAECKSDVFLKTMQGDYLNLKSELSKWVVITMVTRKAFLDGAVLECINPADEDILSEFFEKEA